MSRKLTSPEKGIVQALLRPINTTAIMILGVYTFVWGCWIANPFWDAFSRAPLFGEMQRAFEPLPVFSPEFLWGMIAIISGVVITYGALRPSYKALVRGSTVAFLHWFVITIMYFWGDWQNTGGITAMTFAIYALFIHINVKVNFKNNKKIEEMLN